jgi:hypothetical protein
MAASSLFFESISNSGRTFFFHGNEALGDRFHRRLAARLIVSHLFA